ncbi:MAG TPA: hypothetical protein VKC89_02780 [Patescibacteria group bacterium]|nr:hypothetical protein [Patescibacteria group bacterium]
MERRGGIIGALKETAIQTAIALGKPDATLALSRKFGKEEAEQISNWREAHVVAADNAAHRWDDKSRKVHLDASTATPPFFLPSHQS